MLPPEYTYLDYVPFDNRFWRLAHAEPGWNPEVIERGIRSTLEHTRGFTLTLDVLKEAMMVLERVIEKVLPVIFYLEHSRCCQSNYFAD